MLSNCIKNLLNLKELNLKKVKNSKNCVEVYAELPISEQICPCCGCSTSKIHDHYTQKIHLLLSRRCKIKENRYDELENMLINYSENLRIAYREKEELLDIIHSDESSDLKINKFSKCIKYNLESDIPELQECAKTYQHWYFEIKNSLEVPYSNGPTEGFNNKIKVIKRISFGVREFKNFKARIMLLNRG